MTRNSILAIGAFLLAVIVFGTVDSRWPFERILAQTRRDPTLPTIVPNVLSGENVGVRVTGHVDKNGKIAGTLVVKINGQWIDVVSAPGLVPMSK